MNSLISGYYGMDNTGDNAFTAVTAWGVKEYLNSDRVLVNSPQLPEACLQGGITPVLLEKQRFSGENRIRSFLAPYLSRSVVFGGGSLFHSSEIIKKFITMLKRSGKGPHFALGVSLGPFRDSEAERNCAELLKRMSFVGVRDKESFDIINSIAPQVASAKTFDLALLLPRAAGIDFNTLVGSPRKGIGVALCDCERFVGGDLSREQMRRHKIRDLLNSLVTLQGEDIFLIDFDGSNYCGDRKIHKDILDSLNVNNTVHHIEYHANPLYVLRLISGLRLMVSMRLHASVFAYMAQTPTIILTYHNKCEEWAKEINMPSEFIFDSADFDVVPLQDCILNLLNDSSGVQQLLPVQEAELLSLGNWVMAKKQIGN